MDLVLIALAEAMERERRNIRLMEQWLRADDAAFQEKESEREMLKTNKEEMLADEAAKKKFVADFMAFMEAVENNDPEIAHNFDEKAMMNTIFTLMKSEDFDEKAMMNTIFTMMKSEGSDNGGIVEGDNVPKIKQDVEDKPMMEAALALNNSDGNSGGKFVGSNGEINDASENAPTLGEGGMMPAIQGTNSDGSIGGAAAGIGDSCNGKRH